MNTKVYNELKKELFPKSEYYGHAARDGYVESIRRGIEYYRAEVENTLLELKGYFKLDAAELPDERRVA